MYWNVPTNAYIMVKGSTRKYKLIELYENGQDKWNKLPINGSYFSRGEKYDDLKFYFVFELIPSGSTQIDVILTGKDVYLDGVFDSHFRWEDIYVDFKNIIITNPQLNNFRESSSTAKMNSYEYFNSAKDKAKAGDHYGAIADYTKSIELDPDDPGAYVNRGIAKENLKDLSGACLDWKKAASLGSSDAAKWVANQCDEFSSKKTDLQLFNSAKDKAKAGDHYGAISDYNKAIELKPANSIYYLGRGSSKNKLKDYYGAIADYNKGIELKPDKAVLYYNRGLTKYSVGIDGCNDLVRAKELGGNVPAEAMKAICN